MKNRKSLIAGVLALVLTLGALLAWWQFSPRGNLGSKTITVNVDHLNGTDATFTFKTKEECLRGALEEHDLVDGTEDQYGLWVTTVDGETADESKQEWWGYNVNGEMAVYGVGEQVVSDGDVYDFALNVGW